MSSEAPADATRLGATMDVASSYAFRKLWAVGQQGLPAYGLANSPEAKLP